LSQAILTDLNPTKTWYKTPQFLSRVTLATLGFASLATWALVIIEEGNWILAFWVVSPYGCFAVLSYLMRKSTAQSWVVLVSAALGVSLSALVLVDGYLIHPLGHEAPELLFWIPLLQWLQVLLTALLACVVWTVGELVGASKRRKERLKWSASTSVKTGQMGKRPRMVWVVFVWYWAMSIYSVLFYILSLSGSIPLDDATRFFSPSVSMFDYLIELVTLTVTVIAAIFLFLLRREAVRLFVIAFILSLASVLSHALDILNAFKYRVGVIAIGLLILFLVIDGMVCLYAWNLQKKGMLT
jgi:hypothetical protein